MNRRFVRITSVAVLLLLAITLAGCAQRQAGTTSGGEGAVGQPAPAQPERMLAKDSANYSNSGVGQSFGAPDSAIAHGTSAVTVPGSTQERMMIRNKNMRVRVDKVGPAVEKIRVLAKKHGGSIESMQIANSSDEPVYRYGKDGQTAGSGQPLQGFVTVRVPAKSFNAFIDETSNIGKVEWQAEDSSDVTEQYIDMSARLKNLTAEEVRLREFFDKATKVSDMLSIERELSRVRGEIESLTSQLRYLERQVALATVTIELKEPTPVVSPQGTNWGFKQALTDSVRAFVGTLNGIIVFTGGVLPLLVPLAIAIWLLRIALKRRSAKLATAKAQQEE